MVSPGGTYRPYRPANGTEGEIFFEDWCANCARDTEENPCPLIARALAYDIGDKEYPGEWQYNNAGEPICTAFTETEPEEPRCPDTIDMFT